MNISEVLPNGNVRVVVPIKFRCVKQTKVIVFPENEIGIQMQTPLLTAIANALAWQQMLDNSQCGCSGKTCRQGTGHCFPHASTCSAFSGNHPHGDYRDFAEGNYAQDIPKRPSSRLGRTEEDAWHRVDLR